MTFTETDHPRSSDGRFAEKTGTTAEVSLPDPYGEMTRILIESDEFWDEDHKEWNTEELARTLRSEGITTLPLPALETIIRQYQWRKGGTVDGALNSEGLAAEILRHRSEDEVAIAMHLSRGSGPVFTGKDSTTPEGYFTVFGKNEEGTLCTYLLDDETRSIVGRIETEDPATKKLGRVYAGSRLYGGYYMGAVSPRGHLDTFNDIVREHERGLSRLRTEKQLNDESDARIAAYAARKSEGDSTLEHVLLNEPGINIVLRRKLISAYNSPHGREEIPRLLDEDGSFLKDQMLRDLRRLAIDEDLGTTPRT